MVEISIKIKTKLVKTMDVIRGKFRYKKLKKDKCLPQREKYNDFSSLAHLEIPVESSDSDQDTSPFYKPDSDWLAEEDSDLSNESEIDEHDAFKTVRIQPLYTKKEQKLFEDHFKTLRNQPHYTEEDIPRSRRSFRQRDRKKITDDNFMLETPKLHRTTSCVNEKKSCHHPEINVPTNTNKKFQIKEEIIQIKKILIREKYQNLNNHQRKKQNKKKVEFLESFNDF
ncbi:putative orfan [Tupanvirus soda lake]|uniref:Orfan n=2 Tax=Tupanvirus TaxID=2094720 RepID=A0AC62ADL2_9VIRU|nr:putative orfan [Tupanvirus soda lake]QKU35844.1 putative orfan [Tupanvirus soda lake]